jgi:hypothetical protein
MSKAKSDSVDEKFNNLLVAIQTQNSEDYIQALEDLTQIFATRNIMPEASTPDDDPAADAVLMRGLLWRIAAAAIAEVGALGRISTICEILRHGNFLHVQYELAAPHH